MQPFSLQTSIWLLARKLVRDDQFSVFHIETNDALSSEGEPWTGAIHLILERQRRAMYVRLIPTDSYWSQVVERDVNESKRRCAQLAGRMRAKLDAVNIYVLPEEATNEMEERAMEATHTSRKDPFQLQVLFLNLANNMVKGSSQLLTKWDIQPAVLQHELDTKLEDVDAETVRLETRELVKKREREFLSVFRHGKPYLMFSLLVINAIVYGFVLWQGGATDVDTFIHFGAKSNGHIIEGEWWRLITPMFLHLSHWHFLFNSIALFFLGNAVERIFGSVRFILIYLLAGITGSVASFAFTENLSAGASGAIFGCFGALLVFGQLYPKLFFRTMGRDILFFLGLNLALGFALPNIDNYGHIGGLIGGYLAAFVIGLPSKKHAIVWRILLAAILVALLAGVFAYGYVEGKQSSAYLAWKGQRYIETEQLTKAEPIYDQLVRLKPEEAIYHFNLGYVYSKTGRLDQAKQSWETAIQLDPSLPQAHFNLALLSMQEGDIKKAREHLLRAQELDPDNADIQDLLDQLDLAT